MPFFHISRKTGETYEKRLLGELFDENVMY